MRRQNMRSARELKPLSRFEERLADEARFIKSWFENPSLAGAVSPSGRFLARTMAHYVDPQGTGPVVELGPGTGAITEALLKRGVAPKRLVLVEFDSAFCTLLRRRFPGVRVIQGDAYHLRQTLQNQVEPASAIVSSLPLLNKPERDRIELLTDAFALMAPDGCFIQFTYGMISPVPRKNTKLSFHAEVSAPIWLNLPPARVWVYRPAGERAQDELPPAPKPAALFLGKLKTSTEKMQQDLKREIILAKTRLSRPEKAQACSTKCKPPRVFSRKLPDIDKPRRP